MNFCLLIARGAGSTWLSTCGSGLLPTISRPDGRSSGAPEGRAAAGPARRAHIIRDSPWRLVGSGLVFLMALARAQYAPSSVTSFDRSVLRSMVHAADQLLRARNYAAAESAYAEVLARDSTSIPALVGLSRTLLTSPNPRRSRTEALTRLQQANALSRSNPTLLTLYGEALLPWRLGVAPDTDPSRLHEAEQYFRQALALSPDHAQANIGLHLALLAQGRAQAAETCLSALARSDYFPRLVQDFAYDLLISVDSGGILFTNGDLDTYSVLALQAEPGIRRDVLVVNVSLLRLEWYLRYLRQERGLGIAIPRLTPGTVRLELARAIDAIIAGSGRTRGIFFALTVDRKILDRLKPRLSLEGLVYRVTEQAPDIPTNLSRCRENLTRRYRIPDFLSADKPRPMADDIDALGSSLAAALFGLADACRVANRVSEAAGYLRHACSILIAVGRWSGFERVLEYWLKVTPHDPDALRLKRDYYGK
ncbi:MAG: tetratricopeptide repeat protein [candidate division WOR-3 bacterium]